jgi:hypothetical protein
MLIDFIKRTKKKVDDFIPDINRANIQRATTGIVNRATQIRDTLPVYKAGQGITAILERQKQDQEIRNQERRQREEQSRIARLERERVARDQQRAREQQARENQARIQRERANQPQESLLSRGKKLGGAFVNAYLEQPTIQNVFQRRLDAKLAENAFNQSTKLQEEAMKTTDQNRRQRLLKVAEQIKQPYVGQVGEDKNLKPQEFVKAGAELNFTVLPFVPGMQKGSAVKAVQAVNTVNKLSKAQKGAQAIKLATGAGQATGFVDDIGRIGTTKAIRNLVGRNIAQSTTQAGVRQISTPETKDMSLQDRAKQFGTDVALGTLVGSVFEGGIGGGIKLAEKGIKRIKTPQVKLTPTQTTPQTKTPAREVILAQIEEAKAPKAPTTRDIPTPKKGGTPFDEVEPTPTPRKPDPELEKEIAKLAEPSKADVDKAIKYATTINPNDPFGNSNNLKAIQNTLGSAYDSDYKMLKLLRKVEQETGLKGLEENFYVKSDLFRKSQQIATAKIEASPELKTAYSGMNRRDKREFNNYLEAKKRLANEPISEATTELTRVVEAGKDKFKDREQAITDFYKKQATQAQENGLIDDFTNELIQAETDYFKIQSRLNQALGRSYIKPVNEPVERQAKNQVQQAIQTASKLELTERKNQVASEVIDVLDQIQLAEEVSEAGEDTITRVVNGEKQYWKIPGEIKELVDKMERPHLNLVAKIMSLPVKVFRLGTTGLQAVFAVPAYIMDLAGSAIISKNIWATHNPKVILEGLAQSVGATLGFKSKGWQKFEQMGLAQTLYDDLRNARTSRALERQLSEGVVGRVKNVVSDPIRTLEDIVSIGEKAVRYQNFRGTYRNAIKRGLNEAEAYKEAYLASAKNSVNFARGSDFTRVTGMFIPYFGARTQGIRQMLESFRDRPVATAVKSFALVGLPTIVNTLYNYADEKRKEVYESIDDDEKERNFIIVSPDAKQDRQGTWTGVYKIPKPQGFRELWQPLDDLMDDFARGTDTATIQGMLTDMLGAISPVDIDSPERFFSSVIPQQAKPAVEAYINQNLYFAKDKEGKNKYTVPERMIEGTEDPTKRAYDWTSGSMRMLANRLGVSPIQLEKFVGSTFGKGGSQVVNFVDYLLAEQGLIPKEQIGGQSVFEGFQKRFREAGGELLEQNKTSGRRYQDSVKEATKGLSKQELEAWNTLRPDKENFLGEEIFNENKRISKLTKAGIYLNFPEVLKAERELNRIQASKGQPSNPLLELNDEQLRRVLLKETLPPKAKDPELSNLYEQDWYQEYLNKRDNYYKDVENALIAQGKTLPKSDFPKVAPELQKVMDFYFTLPKGTGARSNWIRNNPQLWEQMTAQWQKKDDWENLRRIEMGLSPVNDEPQTTFTSSGKKGIKIAKPKAPRALSTLLRGKPMSKDVPKVKGSLELVRLKGSKKLPTLKLKSTAKKAPTLKLTKSTTPKPLSVKKIRVK